MRASLNRVRTKHSARRKGADDQGNKIPPKRPLRILFGTLFGAFLGLSLLKFGNPPVMESWVSSPSNGYEFFFGSPWPLNWALWLLALIVIAGLLTTPSLPAIPRWLLALPLIWFGWQVISATQSVDTELSKVTLKHFLSCVVCFYLGCFCLNQVDQLLGFWLGLLCGFALVVAAGWEQHFGGLDETRRYFFLYIYPQMKEVPPGYLKKISSSRIFSTLFYPNTLAGALLLFLPITLGLIEAARRYLTKPAKWFLQALVAALVLACLYWSGSKGGWLLMLLLGLITFLRLPIHRKHRLTFAGAILIAGLAGFFWKYATFFEKGATSVSARFDYWEAAFKTAKTHPLLGTGPGTFFIPYQKLKRPESEPARLVHNDYLEQASDSGWPGFLLYGGLVCGLLAWIFFTRLKATNDWPPFAVWLGLLGWALQSLIEFGLYIPALAWPAFALLGWLASGGKLEERALSPAPAR